MRNHLAYNVACGCALAMLWCPGFGVCEQRTPAAAGGADLYARAVELVGQGKENEAAEEMIRAVGSRPPSPVSVPTPPPVALKHFTQGSEYVRLRYDSLAEKEFRSAIALDPRYTRARYQLAFLMGNRGEYRGMFKELWEAVQGPGGDAERLRALAGLALVARNIPEAIDYYRQAIAKDPSSLDVMRMMGLVLVENGKSREGFAMLEDAVLKAPNDYSTLSTIGLACALRGDYARAEEYLKKAIGLNPQHAEAMGRLGIVLLLEGRTEESIQRLTEAVNGNPGVAELNMNLAKAYKVAGQLDDAEAQYALAIKADPKNYDAWYETGNILSAQGKLDKALDAYAKAAAIEPKLAKTYYKMGLICARKKMYDRAEKQFKQTIRANCDYADAYYALAVLNREHRKDARAAAHYFKMYLVYDSSSERATEAFRWLEQQGEEGKQ